MKKGSKHKTETIKKMKVGKTEEHKAKIKSAITEEHKAKMKSGMLKFWDEIRELKKQQA